MEQSFDLDSYFGNDNNLNKLANHICQPVFLKTKIDVLYNDILNWERYDLLSIEFGIKPEDTSYKKTASALWTMFGLRLWRHLDAMVFLTLILKK